MTKKAYLHSTRHPCTENAMNLNKLKRWFSGNEWEVTRKPSEADVIVVSTCGFSKEQEDYEIDTIAKLGQIRKPGCELVVMGCLPEINRERLKQVFNGPTVPTASLDRFDEILDLPRSIASFDSHTISGDEYDSDPRISFFVRTRKWFERHSWIPFLRVPKILYTVPSEKWFCIRCAMGCTGNCSYCGIKHAHGPYRSEPLESIVRQARDGLARGFREIALTGEDLGAYGVDTGQTLADLLNALVAIPYRFKINIRFIDPYWLIRLGEALMPAFRSGKINAFCCPAQSGSDRILKLMNRRYTFEELKKSVNRVARETGVDMISTNIIVGFPGETRYDLHETMRLIDEVAFGMYMVFRYEDRPGTEASRLAGKTDRHEMDSRYSEVHRACVRKHAKLILGMEP